MTGELIKSFLVGLGFDVDDSSLAKFNKAIASAAIRVTALYASIQVAAAGIFHSISNISEGFEQMGYEYRIIAPAINKAILLRRAMLDAYQRAGINIVQAVQASVLFNHSLAKTKFALDAIYKSVGVKFLPILTKQMDNFRAKIFANMPKIQGVLEKVVKVILKGFQATMILTERVWSILGRVYEAFKKLDKATNGWSTVIVGLIAAWKLLNLEFLASPLGLVLAGLLAILALYDDFKTFQEGGESLFDWGKFIPIIDGVKSAISGIADTISSLVNIVLDLVLAFEQLFQGDFTGAFESIKRVAGDVVGVFGNLWSTIKGIGGALGGIGDVASKIFGGQGAQYLSASSGYNSQPLMAPSTGVSQKVSQETNITVQGSADAAATGKAIAGEQNRVNSDLTRNLKSATQ